jgi:hypothetical protein
MRLAPTSAAPARSSRSPGSRPMPMTAYVRTKIRRAANIGGQARKGGAAHFAAPPSSAQPQAIHRPRVSQAQFVRQQRQHFLVNVRGFLSFSGCDIDFSDYCSICAKTSRFAGAMLSAATKRQ